MISMFRRARERRVARTGNSVTTVAVVAAAAAATGLMIMRAAPSLRDLGETVVNATARSMVSVWAKHIVGVLVCGALIALGNWIYTMFSAQWSQAGMPDLPPMVSRPGPGNGAVPISTAQSPAQGARGSIFTQPPAAPSGQKAAPSFLDEYRD